MQESLLVLEFHFLAGDIMHRRHTIPTVITDIRPMDIEVAFSSAALSVLIITTSTTGDDGPLPEKPKSARINAGRIALLRSPSDDGGDVANSIRPRWPALRSD